MTYAVWWIGNRSCKMLESYARWVKSQAGSQALVGTALVDRTYLSAGIQGRRGGRVSWFRRSAASCRPTQTLAPLLRSMRGAAYGRRLEAMTAVDQRRCTFLGSLCSDSNLCSRRCLQR